MADIRINALATTAASTASDDFIAVDGSANGTRKLNAYSPTFGGNLTVSGTGTFAGAVTINTNASTIGVSGSGTGGNWRFKSDDGNTRWLAGLLGSAGETTFSIYDLVNSRQTLALTAAGNATLAGNLTVSGTAINLSTNNSTDKVVSIGYSTVPLYLTSSYDGSTFGLSGFSANSRPSGSSYTTPSNTSYGNLYFLAKIAASDTASAFEWKHAPRTAGTPVTTSLMTLNGSGNLLIGTTTDSTNGKLQLADHNTSAGGIGFGTDTALFRIGTGLLVNSALSGTSVGLRLYHSAVQMAQFTVDGSNLYVDASGAGGSIILRSGASTTALTLDSSQNATFAGKVTAANLDISGTAIASGTYTGDFIASSGADRSILRAAVAATSNGFTVAWNNTTSKLIVGMANLPTSSSGLAAGTLWNDSGTLKIA